MEENFPKFWARDSSVIGSLPIEDKGDKYI